MNINYFIFLINLVNIAYKHKKLFIKINNNEYFKFCLKYLYKYNYIKNIKLVKYTNKIILFLNYYRSNYINNKIIFLRKKQKFCINNLYLPRLNYNYLLTINDPKKFIVDKQLALRMKKNGKIIAIIY